MMTVDQLAAMHEGDAYAAAMEAWLADDSSMSWLPVDSTNG